MSTYVEPKRDDPDEESEVEEEESRPWGLTSGLLASTLGVTGGIMSTAAYVNQVPAILGDGVEGVDAGKFDAWLKSRQKPEKFLMQSAGGAAWSMDLDRNAELLRESGKSDSPFGRVIDRLLLRDVHSILNRGDKPDGPQTNPSVLAHELGHIRAKGNKYFEWGQEHKYSSPLVGTLLAGTLSNRKLAGASALAASLASSGLLASEIDASGTGYGIMRAHGASKLGALKAFAGVPSYLLATAAPAATFLAKDLLGGYGGKKKKKRTKKEDEDDEGKKGMKKESMNTQVSILNKSATIREDIVDTIPGAGRAGLVLAALLGGGYAGSKLGQGVIDSGVDADVVKFNALDDEEKDIHIARYGDPRKHSVVTDIKRSLAGATGGVALAGVGSILAAKALRPTHKDLERLRIK